MGRVIAVNGYKGFRGVMEIRWHGKPKEEVYGDWIYTPGSQALKFWHCGQLSYPAGVCTVKSVESKASVSAKGYRMFTGVMQVVRSGECSEEIYGNWLYNPMDKRWYSDYGVDYPEDICTIAAVVKTGS